MPRRAQYAIDGREKEQALMECSPMNVRYYPLAQADEQRVAAMREAAAPSKGALDGPHARGAFDRMIAAIAAADGVDYEAGTIGGVPGWWCRPKDARPHAAIIFLHGGCYVVGSAQAFRHFAGQFASRTGVATFVPDYRLAPEHPFPAAIDDAVAAYHGLVDDGMKAIAVVGDSAGGGLALALLAILASRAGRRVPRPVCAAVMSPWTDLALASPSMKTHALADPFLTEASLAATASQYLAGQDPAHPHASPLYGPLAGLPPIRVDVGEHEILLDDARRYVERAHASGVDATLAVWKGMPHVFPSEAGKLEASARALDAMSAFLVEKLDGKRQPVAPIADRSRRWMHLMLRTIACASPVHASTR